MSAVQGTIARVQSIQLLAVLAIGVPLVVIGLLRVIHLSGRSIAVATLIGLVAAAVGTGIVTILRTDVVPDEAESAILPIVLGVVGPILILIALLRRFRR
jgi:hypothetical protein